LRRTHFTSQEFAFRNSSVRDNSIVIKMPKNILVFDLQRPSTAVPWGITVCGGRDQGLTFKIGNVKRMSPASKAGLSKMDYLISINGRPVFNMTHCEMAREIKSSGATLRLECERGDHIVPSFDELFPGLRQDDDPDSTKRKCPGNMMQYYKEAMEHHGLGHMPQPDNFTTIGNNLGIEINQYNCPIDAYSQEAVSEMRDVMEKGGVESLATRGPPKTPAAHKFDPSKSNAIAAINLEERGQPEGPHPRGC